MVAANSWRSRTVSGTGSIEAVGIEAAGIEAAAGGISLSKDRTILAFMKQYCKILYSIGNMYNL